MDILSLEPFIQINEDRTPDDAEPYHLTVDLFVSTQWKHDAFGAEDQKIAWINAENLENYKLLPANIPLIPKIQRYITDRKNK